MPRSLRLPARLEAIEAARMDGKTRFVLDDGRSVYLSVFDQLGAFRDALQVVASENRGDPLPEPTPMVRLLARATPAKPEQSLFGQLLATVPRAAMEAWEGQQ